MTDENREDPCDPIVPNARGKVQHQRASARATSTTTLSSAM
jgi:hypothetical protein